MRASANLLGNDIARIPLPIPFKGLDWINAYAIKGADGITLIDCGIGTTEGHEALTNGFKDIGWDISSVHTLVVSHLHPDHVGLAPRIIEELGCNFVMHDQAKRAIKLYNDVDAWGRTFADLSRSSGAPKDFVDFFLHEEQTPDWFNIIDQPTQFVSEGDSIRIDDGRSIDVLYTPGHEIAHICLKDSATGILFSGDHILPRITPFVGYLSEDHDPNPLKKFVDSLARIRDDGFGLTYPAHGDIVERGSARADQIFLHHERRLNETLDEITTPRSGWTVMGELFRRNLDIFSKRLALRETVSHLEYLRLDNLATREMSTDEWLYHRVMAQSRVRL